MNKLLLRLAIARNIWIATVRPDGRPHLTPVWCIVAGGKIFCCIKEESVKAVNLAKNPRVACSLEDGSSPVICEGTAAFVPVPWPEDVLAALKEKYDWDLATDHAYNLLVEISPVKWLSWN